MIRAIEWPHQGKAACVPPFFYYVELVAILNRTIPLMPGQLNIQVTSDVDLDKLGERSLGIVHHLAEDYILGSQERGREA